jgi:hypothetical protein
MVLKTGVFFMVKCGSVFGKLILVMACRFRQFLKAKVGAGGAFNFPFFAKGKPDFVNSRWLNWPRGFRRGGRGKNGTDLRLVSREFFSPGWKPGSAAGGTPAATAPSAVHIRVSAMEFGVRILGHPLTVVKNKTRRMACAHRAGGEVFFLCWLSRCNWR